MGYFDYAKASREEENTLEHSSGPWKKHKYIQKIGEGANAVYKYAKKSAKARSDWKYNEERANAWSKASIKENDRYNDLVNEYGTDDIVNVRSTVSGDIVSDAKADKNLTYEQAKGFRKTANEKKNEYSKTVFGKVEFLPKNTIDKGKALIKDFFTPKTKVTASSNLTGKETINTKPAEKVTLKKNKLSFKKK